MGVEYDGAALSFLAASQDWVSQRHQSMSASATAFAESGHGGPPGGAGVIEQSAVPAQGQSVAEIQHMAKSRAASPLMRLRPGRLGEQPSRHKTRLALSSSRALFSCLRKFGDWLCLGAKAPALPSPPANDAHGIGSVPHMAACNRPWRPNGLRVLEEGSATAGPRQ
jgi:hypothetical protein